MKKTILNSVTALLFCMQIGCSVQPLRYVVATAADFEDRADIPRIDVNIDNERQISENTNQESGYRVKYHPSYSTNRWMVVEGKLANGNKYPVVLDTGASSGLFVNDVHILENKLAIQPFKAGRSNSVSWGICELGELQIGQVSLINWPCFYQAQHTEIQLFGLSVGKGKAIIAGLTALREFKYIEFDSIEKEAEFSLQKAFEPEQSQLWRRYPFVIEEGLGDNAFLYVKVPIAGEEIELQLDTGSGRGLAISEHLWGRLNKKIPKVRLKKTKDLYPYIGWLDCRRTVVANLQVGDRTIKDAKISVFPDDSQLMDRCEGLIGMQYFQDTVVVLDFERNLLWVRNLQS